MSRAALVRRHLRLPQNLLFDQLNVSGLGEVERKTAFDLMVRLSSLKKVVGADISDTHHLEIERDRLRPILADIRDFALRRNLIIAQPFWGSQDFQRNPNALAYVGADDLADIVEACCEARAIFFQTAGNGWGAGRKLWQTLSSAPIAVFDLRETSEAASEAAYGLGLALAMGATVVVLTKDGAPAPFNLDLESVNAGDQESIGDAIDAAFFRVNESAEEGAYNVANSLDFLIREPVSLGATGSVLRPLIERGDITDPIEVRSSAQAIIADSPGLERTPILSLWPASYPDVMQPSAFHVMPFTEHWSDEAREVACAACEALGISYERGDETGDANVISGIWDSISRAHIVIVDISGLNLNVCIELGMSHALGRPTLLIRRDINDPLFPAVAKLQIAAYNKTNIQEVIERFLKSA